MYSTWRRFIQKRSDSLSLSTSNTTVVEGNRTSLYESCKFVFLFGKAIGLIPYDCGLCNYGLIIRTRGKLASIVGLVLTTLLLCNAMVGLQALARSKFLNAAEYSRAPMMFCFYSVGTFLYWYFYRRNVTFLQLFQRFDSMHSHFNNFDKNLKRDAKIIALVMLCSTIAENIVNNSRFVQMNRADINAKFGYEPKNETFLKIYYVVNSEKWGEMVPYSTAMSFFTLLSDKFAWYAWNFSDVLVLVLSRALCFQFKCLYEQGLSIASRSTFASNLDALKWKQIVRDHDTLCCLQREIEEFVSPLIFSTIAVSTYTISLQIQFSLSKSTNVTPLDNLYAIWSTAHIWMRVCALCVAGSRLHDAAHRVIEVLRLCPSSAMSLDVTRAERYATWYPIGWTGLKCFFVTNNLLLKIISVVFTYEIIILQASQQTGQ